MRTGGNTTLDTPRQLPGLDLLSSSCPPQQSLHWRKDSISSATPFERSPSHPSSTAALVSDGFRKPDVFVSEAITSATPPTTTTAAIGRSPSVKGTRASRATAKAPRNTKPGRGSKANSSSLNNSPIGRAGDPMAVDSPPPPGLFVTSTGGANNVSSSVLAAGTKVSKHRRKADTKQVIMPLPGVGELGLDGYTTGSSNMATTTTTTVAGPFTILPATELASLAIKSQASRRKQRNSLERDTAASDHGSDTPSPSRSQTTAPRLKPIMSLLNEPEEVVVLSGTPAPSSQPATSALSSLLKLAEKSKEKTKTENSPAPIAHPASGLSKNNRMDTDQPVGVAVPPAKSSSYSRICSYCQATTTPMWRHGPPGYQDLCNKCGVKWMRRRILQDDVHMSDS
ncbi:hypothetical protein BASA81_014440 [Batrachochytrium salamandrivorans]|nr:hypothetical protein BASA81_014440 [Batrachochytrium salamandrivorans]